MKNGVCLMGIFLLFSHKFAFAKSVRRHLITMQTRSFVKSELPPCITLGCLRAQLANQMLEKIIMFFIIKYANL